MIPQDIIDTIIEKVDRSVLKNCALVSSSFLLPSRKRLFSRLYLRSDQGCQRLQQFLVENPLILPSVRDIILDWASCTSLITILQLPFCCLECLSINMWDTRDISSELKDAFSTIIHSSTLKTLRLKNINLPIVLFQSIHSTELTLDSIYILGGEKSRLLTLPVSEGVTAIDQDVWTIQLWNKVRGPTEPVFLPCMCRLRVFEIDFDPSSAKMSDFHILSFIIRSLRLSLTSPPTLEQVKLGLAFTGWSNSFDHYAFYDDLRDADFWRHLDSIVTHPTGSRLQRVDIDIRYCLRHDDDVCEPDETEVEEPILDALPLLREQGILFVGATVSG